jgi:hypothetical protein
MSDDNQKPATPEAETDETNIHPPGEGGWLPDNRSMVVGTVGCAICAAVGPIAFAKIPGPIGTVIGVACSGIAAGLGAWLGMRSAGPRKQ